MSKIKRDFSTKVRQPFQDTVATIVRAIDFHNSYPSDREFHNRQATILQHYLIDLKGWIVTKEVEERTESEKLQEDLEPIIHPTQFDESDDLELTKKYEVQEDYTETYWKREIDLKNRKARIKEGKITRGEEL